MKGKTKIVRAMALMYAERARWEVEKSRGDAQPLLGVGYDLPKVEWCPGEGWRINGALNLGTAEELEAKFKDKAFEYKRLADEMAEYFNQERDRRMDLPF